MHASQDLRRRTLVAQVEDLPGVLNRVASLFRRRGYNIESLTVSPSSDAASRMTIVLMADDTRTRLLVANLYKLVNVLHVEDLSDVAAVHRDLVLLRLQVDAQRRPEALQLVEVFGARVVDLSPETLIVELSGSPNKLAAFAEVLQPFGLVEQVHTGVVAMRRESRAAKTSALSSSRLSA